MHIPINETSRIGIDIGRVLIGAVDEGGEADTTFLAGSDEQALATLPEPGGFDVVRDLRALTGAVWLVSKCGKRIESLTRRWLAQHHFHEITGVGPGDLHFVRKRPEKADVARKLRLTHFVDDRLDVLEALRPVVPALYCFGRRDEPAPSWAVPVRTWSEARALLLPATLPSPITEGAGA